MVIDKNRILVGFLILFFFLFAYFIKFDLFILAFISILIILELYKSKFINNISDFFIIMLFISIFPFTLSNNQIIYFLNFLLISFTIINILFPSFYLKKIFFISISIFVFNFFFISFMDRSLLYFIIFIAFFNDTIAYVFGRILKGPLIIPTISPKKTWSGTLISFILTSLVIYQFNISILLSLVLSISLFIGDIFFSYIKRKINIKDFSNFLRGHGGILDRLDSMYFFIMIASITLL